MLSRLLSVLVALLLSGCSGCEPRLVLPGVVADAGDGGTESTGSSGAGDSGAAVIGGDGAVDDAGTAIAGDASVDASSDAATTDPSPVEIDESALIPSSGRQLVLQEEDGRDGWRVLGLDLESGEVHDLLPGARSFDFLEVSPDRRSVLVKSVEYDDGAMGPRVAVVHALDNGFIPARPIEGTRGAPIVESASWTEDSRFAVLTGGVRGKAVFVVDAHKHALHWSAEVAADREGTYAQAAPKGFWFYYALGTNGPPPVRAGVARITTDGIEPIEVDDFRFRPRFSADGKRVVYQASTTDSQNPSTYYRDLPGSTAVEVVPTGLDGILLNSIDAFSTDADHVVARFSTAAGIPDMRSLSLSDGTSTEIGEGGRTHTQVETFAGGREVIVRYSDRAANDFSIVDLRGTWPEEPVETFPDDDTLIVHSGSYGPRHAYYFDSDDEWLGLRLVARDQSGALQRAKLTEPTELQPSLCPVAGDRGAFGLLPDSAIVLLDLSSALARRVVKLAPQHGGSLSCPAWNADGTAFTVVETLSPSEQDQPPMQDQSWIYLARWPSGDAEPSALELVHHAATKLSVVLARP